MFKEYNYCGICRVNYIGCWCPDHHNDMNKRADGCTCGDHQCTCNDSIIIVEVGNELSSM